MSKPALEDLLGFEGRRNRKSYINAHLAYAAAGLLGFLITVLAGMLLGDIGGLISVALFCGLLMAVTISTLAITAQRLHDLGYSGWFTLLMMVPFVSMILYIALMVIPGETGRNDYGPDPLEEPDLTAAPSLPRGGVLHRG